jgi:hypothetical protein
MTEDDLRDKVRQLENKIHHVGYDYSSMRAEYNVLLSRHILPLLSDAVDALELHSEAKAKGWQDTPVYVRIALERVKDAMKAAENKVIK